MNGRTTNEPPGASVRIRYVSGCVLGAAPPVDTTGLLAAATRLPAAGVAVSVTDGASAKIGQLNWNEHASLCAAATTVRDPLGRARDRPRPGPEIRPRLDREGRAVARHAALVHGRAGGGGPSTRGGEEQHRDGGQRHGQSVAEHGSTLGRRRGRPHRWSPHRLGQSA